MLLVSSRLWGGLEYKGKAKAIGLEKEREKRALPQLGAVLALSVGEEPLAIGGGRACDLPASKGMG